MRFAPHLIVACLSMCIFAACPPIEIDPPLPTEAGVGPDAGVQSDLPHEPDAALDPDVYVEPDTYADPDAFVDSDASVKPDLATDPDLAPEPDLAIEPDAPTQPDASIDPDATADTVGPDPLYACTTSAKSTPFAKDLLLMAFRANNDSLFAVFQDGNQNITVGELNGNPWISQNVGTHFRDIAFDANGEPILLTKPASGDDFVVWSRSNAVWSSNAFAIPQTWTVHASAVDANAVPHIVFSETPYTLQHATYTNAAWSTQTIYTSPVSGKKPHKVNIDLDDNGAVHMVFRSHSESSGCAFAHDTLIHVTNASGTIVADEIDSDYISIACSDRTALDFGYRELLAGTSGNYSVVYETKYADPMTDDQWQLDCRGTACSGLGWYVASFGWGDSSSQAALPSGVAVRHTLDENGQAHALVRGTETIYEQYAPTGEKTTTTTWRSPTGECEMTNVFGVPPFKIAVQNTIGHILHHGGTHWHHTRMGL